LSLTTRVPPVLCLIKGHVRLDPSERTGPILQVSIWRLARRLRRRASRASLRAARQVKGDRSRH
jgi:hypothetical protein